jgi:solute carrier family 13 (sodium-dependent dicarboxylate transporter), member 2/3/5
MFRQAFFRVAGPALALLVYLLLRHQGQQPALMAGLVAWMAIWWISEAVPIPVTSLLPLVLYPMLGIDTVAATAAHYGREIIFLFLGGFIIALGIERSGAHRRIALHIVARIGGSPSRLVLGMMVACAVLSMWINSTAATLVMLPIALSLLDDEDAPAPVRQRLTVPLLLAVAYGATIGGMATPVGTPPNLVLLEYMRQFMPDVPRIGFGQWMSFGVPLATIFLVVGWLVVTRLVFRVGVDRLRDEASVVERLKALGTPSADERRALFLFLLVAVAWMTGDDLVLGERFTLPGWRSLIGAGAVTDAALALAGAILLFILPSTGSGTPGARMMDWHFAESRVPWGVLLLIGGGFALAGGVDKSGLSEIIGEGLSGLGTLHPLVLIAVVALIVCLLSELGSNTATASLVIPILAGMSARWGMDPQALLIPATLGASLGFMLPVASPMQTIVFGTGRIPMASMVRAGVVMDLVGVLLLALFFGFR